MQCDLGFQRRELLQSEKDEMKLDVSTSAKRGRLPRQLN